MKKNILIIKDYNLESLLICIFLIVVGIVATYYFSLDFNYSDINSYIGPFLLVIGFLTISMREVAETFFDKESGIVSYKRKTINRTVREKTFSIHKVKRVLFYDKKAQIGRHSKITLMSDRKFIREIKIILDDDTVCLLKKNESNFSIWGRGLWREARKLSDFLEVELKTL